MNKKYQIFVSSTYEDLKIERQKVMNVILQLEQFPAGMEMFGASDEDQWSRISRTIDLTDYYILIVGRKYGTIIDDESDPDCGISYTEKEFNYAISNGIPVLAFVLDDRVTDSEREPETDSARSQKLEKFKKKVMTGRLVDFWSNADDLSTVVAQSLSKALERSNRPGWVRATESEIEKIQEDNIHLTEQVRKLGELIPNLELKNSRCPMLQLEVFPDISEDGKSMDENMTISGNDIKLKVVSPSMSDVENGINYRDAFGKLVHADREDVRLFRYLCKNVFPLRFILHNKGNAVATGARVDITFSDHLHVVSGNELLEYIRGSQFRTSKDAYEGWNRRFFAPGEKISKEQQDNFISVDELKKNSDIENLLDTVYDNEALSIFPKHVHFETSEVRHKDNTFFRGIYILPDAPGVFEINCDLICNEYADSITQNFSVTVE